MDVWKGPQARCQASSRRWSSSRARLGRSCVVSWCALLLGAPQGCWARDPCQGLLARFDADQRRLSRDFSASLEFLACIRQDGYCRDSPGFPCRDTACNTEVALSRARASSAGSALLARAGSPAKATHTVLASSLCPLTCHVCGPQRQVEPALADILRGPCEPGWSYADGACFKYGDGGQDGAASWFSAEKACRAEGSRLATVATKAHEHLVYSLIRQRPARLGVQAWIGLWTGPMGCSHNSTNWRWVGTPQRNISLPMERSYFPAACEPGLAGAAHAMCMVSHGGRPSFRSAPASTARHAWVCSSPALYRVVAKGLCEDFGLLPIYDLEVCQVAAKALAGVDAIAAKAGSPARPDGCRVTWSGAGQGQAAGLRRQAALLCRAADASGQAAAGAARELEGLGEGVQVSDLPPFSRPVVATLLAVGVLPVLAVLALRWHDLAALKQHVALLLSRLRARKLGAAGRAAGLQQQRHRRTITSVVAASLAAFSIVELVILCFAEESVCLRGSALPQVRLVIVLMHLGSLWVAGSFLAIPDWMGWKSSRPNVAFVFTCLLLDVIQSALAGHQALLVETPLYGQLAWRLLFGACTSPATALLSNILYTTGRCMLYKALIPDSMILAAGSSYSGSVRYQGGCGRLWSRQDILSGKELLLEAARSHGRRDSSAATKLEALLEDLLLRQTSFIDFVVSEILLVAVVMICLSLLATLMSKEILKSLRLQSSEGQLLAVSQIFDRLCDATCQLSPSFHICSCSPKLDAILHLSTRGLRATEGTDFCSFIASEEHRARFEAFIARGMRAGFGDALYLDLKGASGVRVRMQLLCARFTDVLGQPRILCGLNELQGAEDWCGPLVLPRRRGRRRRRARSGGSSSSGSGSSSERDGGGSSAEEETDLSRRDCRVEVAADEDLSVLSASRAFEDLLGAEMVYSGRPCLGRLLAAEPGAVAAWVRSFVEAPGTEELRARGEVSLVLNTFSEGPGVLTSEPYQALCRVEPLAAPSRARLQVLRARRLRRPSPPPPAGGPRSSASRSSVASGTGAEL